MTREWRPQPKDCLARHVTPASVLPRTAGKRYNSTRTYLAALTGDRESWPESQAAGQLTELPTSHKTGKDLNPQALERRPDSTHLFR